MQTLRILIWGLVLMGVSGVTGCSPKCLTSGCYQQGTVTH